MLSHQEVNPALTVFLAASLVERLADLTVRRGVSRAVVARTALAIRTRPVP